MTKAEEKKQLRAQIRAEEAALSQRYRESADAAIAARVLAMPEYLQAGTVFCFVSTPREIDTRPILADALARGKRLCVPLCAEKGVMELRRITALDQLAPGAYGIPEPPADSPAVSCDETDFAVIPCLSCDRSGRRLGRGGGYYDRFLSAYRGGAVLVCRERLVRGELPVEPHDRPVPWVATERCLYEDGIPAREE
jgi:5-formyltetrahydrofolate cyclo-ligase